MRHQSAALAFDIVVASKAIANTVFIAGTIIGLDSEFILTLLVLHKVALGKASTTNVIAI